MPPQVRHKEFRFPVDVSWEGARRTVAQVEGKPPLHIATPPEFRGSDPDRWSPEDAFVAAIASCLAVTIAALADRDNLLLRDLSVRAVGVVGRRSDGRFGFVRIEQSVAVEVEAELEETARALVSTAEDGCLVAVSLDVPIDTVVDVRTPVSTN
jgi:organic hydroperoxide reductase OsmC/OhrA